MKIKCQRKECGYEWDYKGSLTQTTCPNCGRKTEVKETEAFEK